MIVSDYQEQLDLTRLWRSFFNNDECDFKVKIVAEL